MHGPSEIRGSDGSVIGLLLRQTGDAAALQAPGFTRPAIEAGITVLREGCRQILQPFRR